MEIFEKTIKGYLKELSPIDNVFWGDKITNTLMLKHKYCELEEGERPLIVVNKGGMPFSGFFTGMVITNKYVHFRLVKDGFWVGLIAFLMKPIIGKEKLTDIKLLQIGEHDAAFGTAYIGHQLIINDKVYGLLRMGTGIEYNDSIIQFINKLSSYLVDKKIFSKKPIEYSWQ